MDERCLTNRIDKYLVSPKYNVILYKLFEKPIQKLFQEEKRLFLFNFKSLESLLFWLQDTGNQERVELTGITWNQWDNFSANIGTHENTISEARTVPSGIALMIFAGDYCCSVTAIKL